MDEAEATRLVLIPAGPSGWEIEGRLVGNADVPIAESSHALVERWTGQLRDSGLNLLFSAPGGPAYQTARLISGALRVRHRTEIDLADVNLGLWQGLFLDEVKQRHPKAFRQWFEQPASVTPPEGERLASAQQRIERCLAVLIKKYHGHKLGVVLGPLGLALARIAREEKQLDDLWTIVKEPLTWHEYLVKCNGVPIT